MKRRGKLERKLKEIWRRFSKNVPALIGLALVGLFVFAALFADFLIPYSEVTTQHIMDKLKPPSAEHWFGTDGLGRDIFARVVHGTRYSLMVGIVTTLIAIVIGLSLAAIAAYYGGFWDNIIMRSIDVVTSIPALLFALSLVAALGASVFNLFLALTVITIPPFVRIIRSSILNVVNQEYIEAAHACGTSTFRILTKHVLANAVGTIIVAGTMSVSQKILTAATLSFLGLGFQPPTPEWGAMLSEARQYIRVAGYMIVFPGFAIILSTMGINLVGDGLRDALDPKLKN